MFERYANCVHKFRFVIILVWLVATAAVYLGLPQLDSVVAHKNTQFLPSNSNVVVAQNLLQNVDPAHTSKSSAVVAIHNPNGLTNADKQYFMQKLTLLAGDKAHYGLHSIQDAYNTDASVASKFNSADGTVEIAMLGFPGQDLDQSTSNALAKVKQVFASPPADAPVLFTGDVPIQQDEINTAIHGAEKTASVTVILVLIILLIVFRSIVAPLVTLLSIGLSFLMSSNIVAWLATLGLPVSTFTKTFLIAIIFGAGTDYSIIILNRYREELGHGRDPVGALAAAFRGISKTVIFSALTVFVSFAILYFAHFGLYRTAVGVAVGIFITLLTCLMFIPALILSLGRIVFWPRKTTADGAHKPSRIWSRTGRIALNYPWWTILCVAIVLVPIGLLFTDKRTFNPMSDTPTAPSVNGFHTVANAFGPGDVLPMDIVLKSPKNLRSPKGLTTIENISQAVAKLNGVKEVDSATRPQGKVEPSFQLASQNQQAGDALNQVQKGLNTLASQFGSPAGSDGTIQLTKGAKQVQQGAAQVQQGLHQAVSQTGQLAAGAKRLQQGAASATKGEQQLNNGVNQTQQGASQLAAGLSQATGGSQNLSTGTSQLNQSATQLAKSASQLANAIAAWAKAHPGDTANANWQQITKLAQGVSQGTIQASQVTKQLAGSSQQLHTSLQKLQSGADKLETGTKQIASSQQRLSGALSQIAGGSGQLASGSSQLEHGLQRLSQGANQLAAGSSRLASGVSVLNGSLSQMGNGLTKADNALNQLKSGVGKVKTALQQSAQATNTGDPGFYVPASVVSGNANLQKAMNAYISPDGHTADIHVILSTNPYTMQSIQHMPDIKQQAEAAFIQSPIHTGQLLMTGTTPTQAELNRISTADFNRTMALVLIAIFILLVILLRSVIAPLYIILSLAGTYFVTMGVLQTFAIDVLGKAGVSWTVPFFVFLLLVALGVDYCIFLMTRFDEELIKTEGLSIRTAMHNAMKNMGNVIFSAAAIMAGTFGSMAVSGVVSLVEIGISVIVGLFFYSVILLAFFVPACAAVTMRGYFWPFRQTHDEVMK